jgi:very-short-patch-repair endonuclease
MEDAHPPLDRALAALAGRQYGVVARDQLRALGLGETGIAERLRTARLLRLHRGVYAVGHLELRRQGHWLAAVLACGEGAVLSHASAAALWNIRGSAATVVDVTVPTRAGRGRRTGMRVHRTARLTGDEVTVHEGIPVTSVARTLLDLADVLPESALKRAIDETEFLRLFDLTALTTVVHSNPGRRGTRLLRASSRPPELTRSQLEERFLGALDRHGLPRPEVNVRVGGFGVDFLWRAAGLIVETDGWQAHGTRAAFERDRLRDRRLARAGFATLRVTRRAVRYDEEAIVDDVRALLTRSRPSSYPPRRARISSASAR